MPARAWPMPILKQNRYLMHVELKEDISIFTSLLCALSFFALSLLWNRACSAMAINWMICLWMAGISFWVLFSNGHTIRTIHLHNQIFDRDNLLRSSISTNKMQSPNPKHEEKKTRFQWRGIPNWCAQMLKRIDKPNGCSVFIGLTNVYFCGHMRSWNGNGFTYNFA